jgi:glycosyltransferase involved in cell wall biosynthesis
VNIQTSVVIPTYNRVGYLGEALSSVFLQTLQPYEVIVADDGSTDATESFVKETYPQVRYCRSMYNQGISGARNMGLRLVRGTHVAFLDSDDLWAPDKLEKQLQVFQENVDVDAVVTYYEEFVTPEMGRKSNSCGQFDHTKTAHAGYCAGTLLVRREIFDRTGLFDESVRVGEFIEWFSRATDSGMRSLLLPHVLMKRRIHPGNTIGSVGASFRQYTQVIKGVLNRRRNASGLDVSPQ